MSFVTIKKNIPEKVTNIPDLSNNPLVVGPQRTKQGVFFHNWIRVKQKLFAAFGLV